MPDNPNRGFPGKQGEPGQPGERGKQGDHGQDGREGIPGTAADVGMTTRTANRLRALTIGVLLAALLGAFLIQRQQQSLEKEIFGTKMSTYDRCIAFNDRAKRLNELFAALSSIEKTNPYTEGQIGPRRVAAYDAAKFDIVNCGAKPQR